MTSRKNKILILQFFLLIAGIFFIFLTFVVFKDRASENIISDNDRRDINLKLTDKKNSKDVFYNIKYSGIDLSGNRYILEAEEAFNNELNDDLLNLKFVDAIFYFKDSTVLYVSSDYGLYNNKNLNMSFEKNVKGNYEESELFAEKAEYSNTKGFLKISDNVRINDVRGNMLTEKLIFDIKNNKLDINSEKNNKINLNTNEKKF